MAMNITTLEDRIRADAFRRLRVQTEAALRPLRDMIAWTGCRLVIPAAPREDRPADITVPVSLLLDLMETQIPDSLIGRRGNEAVEQFVKEVWLLKDQMTNPEILNEAGHD